MKPTPKSVDAYLAGLPADQRAALGRLRRAIRAAVPKAEECIAYGVPSYRLEGKFLVGFGAARAHCSFYPGSAAITAFRAELRGYATGKGTIRFPADAPLPARLVGKLVRARAARLRA